jgi:hypothetical protein
MASTDSVWTKEEQIALAQAWADVTENQSVDQSGDIFWNRVKSHFHNLVGSQLHYRTVDALTSKWNDMRLYILRFQRYFEQADNPIDTEDEVILEALVEYQCAEEGPFIYLDAWAIVKDHPDF